MGLLEPYGGHRGRDGEAYVIAFQWNTHEDAPFLGAAHGAFILHPIGLTF
jgi:hypothetical protein